MKKLLLFTIITLGLSCAEKLMEKPDNLIPQEKMIEILNDLAIVNAAKSTNVAILRNNDIEPMPYLYAKHGIDSVQFVESDRYYASLPEEYEAIYIAVEARLEKEKKRMEEVKKVNDSLRTIEMEVKRAPKKTTDSLP